MNFKTRLASEYLKAGGVISHPTDTIQGLSCLPRFEHSMHRLLKIKQRSAAKGLILLASDARYLEDYVAYVSQLKSIKNTDVPTTYLLKASSKISKLLMGEFSTVAIRLTDNTLIAELCKATNSALVSSSANTTGKHSATSVLNLNVFFKGELDFMIAPKNYNNSPSRIINLETGESLR
ncbi:L-threonylcarbamoyladenylate synthase [Candidatus Thioglobus sp.]|jgi:Putative translation factor (SUA5)|uniref:L-threonylcarbamoyladenylate synthase n=1 Tax=Candidatus Thioglobus sp. TaxID=2026721 RepID=UPI003242C1A2